MERKIHAYLYTTVIIGFIIFLAGGCSDAYDANNTIRINGSISDQTTNESLSGVLVEITDPPEFAQRATTDSSGTYSFEIESEENVNVSIRATKDTYQEELRSLSAESGTDLNDINLALSKSDSTGDGDGSDGGDGQDGTEGPGAAAITLSSTPASFINIAETGNNVQTPITFQVLDSSGQALTAQKSIEVQFQLSSSPGGDERLVPNAVETNGQGQATTTLYSGNTAGEVKLRAVIDSTELGFAMSSSPVQIAIHGGFPDTDGFSLSRERKNMEAFAIDNVRTQFQVILGDKFSNPVSPGTIVYFKTTGGSIQGSGATDADGVVQVELISNDPRPENGIATVTASTVGEDDQRIRKTADIVFSTSKASIESPENSFNLAAGKNKEFSYSVADLKGNPLASGTTITVEGPEDAALSGDTDITLKDYLNTGGNATDFDFTIRNTTEGEQDLNNQNVTITVTAPSGTETTYSKISGTLRGNDAPEAPDASSIELTTPPADAINIAATGENVSTPLAFQVLDTNGDPLAATKAVDVQFTITSSPGGDEKLSPTSATTDESGQASTTLVSGNQAGVVQIRATIMLPDGSTVKSEPVSVSIHGGFPDEDYFNISASTQNVDAASDELPTVNVTLGDQFSNPVKPGTAVSFKTSSGIIQGSANTDENGNASVEFTSLKPRRDGGEVIVTATTVDDSNQSFPKELKLIFSSPEAEINTTDDGFEIKEGARQVVEYTVTDSDGNPMAAGTQISVEGNDAITLSGDTNVTLDDNLNDGPGSTDFSFTIQDNGTSENENISLQVTTTPPSGRTTSTVINGNRIIEGNDVVGAAAIVLTEQPANAININETGDEVSTPLTFQVRDSLGRSLTAENAVEVQFELASSPGGGEDLKPKKATTDGNGNVTTTLFSGNRAGEVKVRAIVDRPEVGLTVRSTPILVAIHGGFPVLSHFSLAPAKNNFEGFNINNNRNELTVVLGDQFSNPVKPGTVVYFETTGGVVQGSAQTNEDGVATVDLISANPRPTDGIATVTAYTVNNSDARIQKTENIVMSTSRADIKNVSPTTFDIKNGEGQPFEYTVEDLNGNPMAAGTQISIDAGESMEVSGDANFTLGDHTETGPGATDFKFSISDTDDESSNESSLTIRIEVTTPSGETTSYTIQGTRAKQ